MNLYDNLNKNDNLTNENMKDKNGRDDIDRQIDSNSNKNRKNDTLNI